MPAFCLLHCHLKHTANMQLKVLLLMSTKAPYDTVVCAPCICLKRISECTSGSSLNCSPSKFSCTDSGTALDSDTVSSGSGDNDEVPFSGELSTGWGAANAAAAAAAGDFKIFDCNLSGGNVRNTWTCKNTIFTQCSHYKFLVQHHGKGKYAKGLNYAPDYWSVHCIHQTQLRSPQQPAHSNPVLAMINNATFLRFTLIYLH